MEHVAEMDHVDLTCNIFWTCTTCTYLIPTHNVLLKAVIKAVEPSDGGPCREKMEHVAEMEHVHLTCNIFWTWTTCTYLISTHNVLLKAVIKAIEPSD